MDDIIKQVGATKSSKPDAGGANIRNVPTLGVVKNNIDPAMSGRIQVYLADLGSSNPDDPSGWVTVSYMSPFFGFVEPKAGETTRGDYVANPSSYGVWNSPPDIGSVVVCIFIDGDPNYGYYIGCVPKPEALFMVPAIGSSDKIITNNDAESSGYAGATRLPVTNINTNNPAITDNPGFASEPRPVHSYTAAVMSQQGIIRDPIRGPISSSAQRETPSRVGWGVSTPGRPIYEGGFTDENISKAIADKSSPEKLKVIARRGGHSIVMDDGDLIGQDQLVRIRTALGHQILMSDDGQTLFILHANGQSYIELGKEGTIDMFSTNSVNIRTQGDLNLHADNNVNIHAAKKMNIYAEEMNIQTEKDTNHKVGGNYSAMSVGNYTHKVLGAMSMKSGGDSSFASSATTFINGAKINLNTGSTSTAAQSVQPIQQITHADTLHDTSKGWVAAPGKLKSITSRTPAHAPWADAGKGVDVKVSSSAAAALPPAPSAAVVQNNSKAAATSTNTPVTPATVSTVPAASAVSKTIDNSTSSAMVASAAERVAADPAKALAAKNGAAIVQTATGPAVIIGATGLTPKELETAGYLKPGSASLINNLIKSSNQIESSLPPNMFTGKDGITDLKSIITNVGVQTKAKTATYSAAQSALMNMNILSGKEAPESIAGTVMAAAELGTKKTADMINTPTTNVTRTSSTSEVGSVINAGNYAATLAQNMGGARAISIAVSALGVSGPVNNIINSAARGAPATAFAAMLASIVPLKTGEPQNLSEIAKQAAKERKSPALSSGASQVLSTVGGIIGGPAGAAISNVQSIYNAVGAVQRSSSPMATIAAVGSVVNNISKNIRNFESPKSQTPAPYTNTIYSTPTTNTQQIATPFGLSTDPTILFRGLKGAMNSAGALGNAKSLQTTIAAGTSLLRNISSIVTNKNSTSSSGLSLLPGGQSLAAASSGTRIFGTESIQSLISNSSTSSLAGISLANAQSTASGLLALGQSSADKFSSTASSLLAQLKSGLTLTSATAQTVSADVSTKINAAIAASTSTGSSPTNAPISGESTFDRSGIDSQMSSLLQSAVIPKPSYSGPSAGAKAEFAQIEQKTQSLIEAASELIKLQQLADKSKNKYYELDASLPKGSPEIAMAKAEWLALAQQIDEKSNQIRAA